MKRLVASIVLLSLCSFAFAKSPIKGLPKECNIFKPYYSLLGNEVETLAAFEKKGYGQQSSVSMSVYWDVYSDRKDNPTFTAPNAKQQYSTLGFKEKVRIASIRRGMALVYAFDENGSEQYPQLPPQPEWKGWIPMTNLINVDKTLVNWEGVYIRALLRDAMEYSAKTILTAKMYDSPTDRINPTNLPNRINSYFYVIKQEGEMYLLATSPDINKEDNIYGWIAKEDLLIWRGRLALEPTWDIVDYEFFCKNRVLCNLMSTNGRKQGNIAFDNVSPIANVDQNVYRMRNGMWRFPLLTGDAESFKCAVSGRSPFLKDRTKKIPVVVESMEEGSRPNVNILFVMDGSRLYEPFFPVVAERVSLLGNAGADNIKVGATIYHDARNTEYMIERQELVHPSSPELYEFIDQGGTYGFRDNLSDAPLLAALKETVDQADCSAEDENVIIVIGGRGDNADGMSPDDISEAFSAKHFTVYALQVQNNDATNAYRMFSVLMSDIIQASIQNRYNVPVTSVRQPKEEWQSSVTTFSAHGYDSVVYDTEMTVNSGIMSEDDFSALLDDIFNRIGEKSAAYGAISSTYPEFFRLCDVKKEENDRKLFKEVVLYNSVEFENICKLFAQLHDLYVNSNPDRSEFFSVIYSYIPTSFHLVKEGLVSPYEEYSKIMNALKLMGYRELLSLIEGISGTGEYYKGHTMKELASEKNVPKDEYEFILKDLSRKYYRLLEIKNSPSIYRSIINGEPHYWVPVDDLR